MSSKTVMKFCDLCFVAVMQLVWNKWALDFFCYERRIRFQSFGNATLGLASLGLKSWSSCFFLFFFVFDFVFLPALNHINPDKLIKKNWKRRTHFFGPRDGKLSMAFSNTLGSRKVPFSGGELIVNWHTHQSSHLFWGHRSSCVDILSKSPCFWSTVAIFHSSKMMFTSSNLGAWVQW